MKQVVLVTLLCCVLYQAPCQCKQYALNVPVVLLPYVPPSTGVKANFTLTSPQGCFTWTSTKPDIVSVEPVYSPTDSPSGCSRQALLTAQSTQPTKLNSIIIAEERATGLTLRCDVFVTSIIRIEITTRTRELLLGEEPERFEVQTFDDEGNMFSTVRGHIFEWTLLPDEEAVHQQAEPESILNFIPFEESSYSTDPIIGRLENMGLQGDTVLVAGVNTGTAKVQVKLTDRAWQEVQPDIVKLLVIENIMLQPSMDVYILPLSFIDYQVERRKHGRSEVITMPSEQYSLELTNTTVGELNSQRSRVTGLVVGYTEIVLQDINMLHTPSASKPSAGIHVVPPHHLGFSIAPGNNWVLEVGREYAITVNVFNKMNHKFIVTENVPLSTELPSTYLQSHFSSQNGSYHFVKALKKGVATLHSTLSKMKHPETGDLHDLPTPVSKQQIVEINDPVLLTPKQLVILWDPDTEYRYQHRLNVTGGSGNYQWSCDPEGIVGVANNGILTAIAKGKTLVVAADTKNTAHFDETEVFVVPPADMSFLPSRVETLIGSQISLPLQVKGYASLAPPTDSRTNRDLLIPFPDCRKLNLDIRTSDSSIFNLTSDIMSSLPDGACTSLKATAISAGHTKVTVTYKYGDIFLQAVITIAAYPPLRPVDPEIIAVVTVGSSKNFVFEGGPAPWVLDQTKFQEKLTSEQSNTIATHHVTSTRVGGQQHIYRVVCLALGEETLSMDVGNGPTSKNLFPANETTSARISCALPVSMVIQPVIRQMPDCPLLSQTTNQNVQFPVRSGRPLDLELTVYDAENRPFDNFTSLQWTWGSSNQNVLPTPLTTSLVHHEAGALMTVSLSHESGTAILTAFSNRYIQQYLMAENITPQPQFAPGVNFSLSLLLRTEPELSPIELVLYNHPQNKAVLNINHGSGHFRVDHVTKTRPPANAVYSSDIGEIALTPVVEGVMKISVYDLCLEVDKVATSVVHVAGVYSIEVTVTDKLQLGNSTLAFVRVLDNRHVPFPANQLRYMNLLANPKSSHIAVNPASNQITARLPHDKTSHSAVFDVHGVVVGTTHLVFNATSSGGRVINSWPREVQVFDSLQLFPEYITLLTTATFQIRSSGGPMPHSTIVYSISNITVATVDDAGLIEAKTPGVAIVTGQAQAVDSNTGQVVTYSQDEVHLRVIRLTGVKLFVPSTRLLSGVEVAIYAYGLGDETPFSFASALPGLSFHWSASNMDVLSLVSVYDKAGVSLQEEQDFTAMLRSRNPGQGTVRLTAKCGRGACEPELATFTDHVQLRVLPPLELLRPCDGHLLLPHNGVAKITTNRDGVSRLSYQLLQNAMGGGSDGVISVSPQGEITTAAVNGHAVVMVMANEEDMGLNQSVVVHVEVRPIASLSIVPLSLAQATPTSKNHAFPLGYSAEFIAYLHDNIGRMFDYASVPLSHRLSRSDIIQVSPESGNATYIVKAAKQGDVILKIWITSQSHVSDYVRVRVGYAILPSLATVHLGTAICFTTHLTESTQGVWSVGEEGVIQIVPETGVGVAQSTGRAVVYHSSHSAVDTHTEITVSKVQKVEFLVKESSLQTFTNSLRQTELGTYLIPVQFYHSNKEPFSAIHTSPHPACTGLTNTTEYGTFMQQVPFECRIELQDMRNGNSLPATKFIQSKSFFDAKTGESFCQLEPTSDTYAAETIATVDRLALMMSVRASDSLGTYELLSGTLKVPFVAAFVVSRREIRLSGTERSTDVKVTGLPQQLQALKVVSPYPISAVKLSAPSPTEATYRISLLHDYHPSSSQTTNNLKVTFSTVLAQQVTDVIVTILPPEETDGACPEPISIATTAGVSKVTKPTPPPTTPKQPDTVYELISDDAMYYIAIVLTLLAVLVATLVICMAIKQGSSRPTSGFGVHLRPGPPQQAFTPVATPHTPSGYQTPNYNHRTPPIPGQYGGGSAFKRPGQGGSPSPQHGLFSQ